MKRMNSYRNTMVFSASVVIGLVCSSVLAEEKKPNMILMMCDDLGYGDVGFNGNTVIKTPHLDAMAKEGANLTHFYAAGPVCSPTRGTFVTGRHYFRYGIFGANVGHLPKQEITLSEQLKKVGYATGHFGKWHLGTLSREFSPKGDKRKPAENYSPPSWHGYDTSFVIESAPATWDPGSGPRARNNPFYQDGKVVTENLDGGAARVVMDRVIPFIEKSSKEGKPFVAVIWFNAPHEDIVAGPEYLKMYPDKGPAAHYFGCVTEIDDQVGRLQKKLKELGVYDNTLQFFTSDNGPEGGPPKPHSKRAGSAGEFSGRKRDLFDGGVRVPHLAVWPGKIAKNSVIDVPASTMDYFPTANAIAGVKMPDQRPIDGEDISAILRGQAKQRKTDIPFIFGGLAAVVRGKYKLMTKSTRDGSADVLFDLSKDVKEAHNVIAEHPELAKSMRESLVAKIASFEKSFNGEDYTSKDFQPIGRFRNINSLGKIRPKNNGGGAGKSDGKGKEEKGSKKKSKKSK